MAKHHPLLKLQNKFNYCFWNVILHNMSSNFFHMSLNLNILQSSYLKQYHIQRITKFLLQHHHLIMFGFPSSQHHFWWSVFSENHLSLHIIIYDKNPGPHRAMPSLSVSQSYSHPVHHKIYFSNSFWFITSLKCPFLENIPQWFVQEATECSMQFSSFTSNSNML